MKTLIVILAALLFSSCTQETKESANPIETDLIPCVSIVPITANQTQYMGDVVLIRANNGIVIQINSVNAQVEMMHIKFSTTQLNGNLAPGQFPIHVSNPLFPYSQLFTWEELGLNGEPNELFVYIHFQTNIGTAWAGDLRRSGKGQWYYYSIFDFCN